MLVEKTGKRVADLRKRNQKINLDKEMIRKMYLEEKKIPKEISSLLGVSTATVRRRLADAGLKIRSHSEAIKISHANGVYKKVNNGHGINWNGGRKLHQGYVQILVGKKKYKSEHRLVMEKYLGRKLKTSELVHHKNGIRTDNRLSNLAIVSRENHSGEICCPKCSFKFLIK